MPPEHDIIVIGGGPIGLACASLLAARRIRTCVLDALPLQQAQGDGRLLALSRGSLELLQPLLGGRLPRHAPIREVYVSSSADFGATHIGAADFGGEALGATVYYGDLLAALAATAAEMPEVEVRRPAQALDVRQGPDGVEVHLADGAALRAALAIHAEGNAAAPPAAAGDWAVIADVQLQPAREDLPSGAAFERFTRSGPLALLPTPAAEGARGLRTLALIWCMGESEAGRRVALNDADASAELQAAIGPRIGTVIALGARRAIPLPRRVRAEVNAHRVVFLGNAAQTLHPVAGQGFNLGLRDCVTLADEVAQAGLTPESLARYGRRRRIDRAAITLLTRAMPGVFASGFAPLALARGLGLAVLDTTPLLRRELACLLMFGARS